MHISYDYDELIKEFEEELEDGILYLDSEVKIIRKSEPVYQDYRPIIDWYYIDQVPPTLAQIKQLEIDEANMQIMTVEEVLEEMRELDNPLNTFFD